MSAEYSREKFAQAAAAIVSISHDYYRKGWLPATSGNFSMRLDDNCCAITVSGKDKSKLTVEDVMAIDFSGYPLSSGKPSAETELHLQLYRDQANVAVVLHTHSPTATILSRLLTQQDAVILSGYELLKAFKGIDRHDVSLSIPIFENTQDMMDLAGKVAQACEQSAFVCDAYLIRGHGLYVWGEDMGCAVRNVEALEFLFACELESLKFFNRGGSSYDSL